MFLRSYRILLSVIAVACLPLQALAALPDWTENLPAPRARSKHAAVYDSHRKRMIVFGGRCQDACCPNGPVPNDTWMLALDASARNWVQVYPGGTSPAATVGPAAIYDPVRDDQMLVAGSSGAVWSLALAPTGAPQWSQLVVTGSGPSPSLPTAVYDSARDQMVVVTSAGAWTLTLPGYQWTKLTPTGRTPAGVNSAIYDPVRDRVVVFADSVRALSLGPSPAWTLLTNNAVPRAHSTIYDPVRDRAVLHGGCIGGDCGSHETWTLSLAGAPVWTMVANQGPLVSSHSAIYDPDNDRMVVFGGYALQFYAEWSSRELWTMSLSGAPQWTDRTAPNPPRACSQAAARDPLRDRMLVYDDSLRATNLTGLPSWTTLATTGTPPAPRRGHSLVQDPARDRLVLLGGYNGIPALPYTDVWALALSGTPAWSALAPSGVPPVAPFGPAVRDPARDRLLIVGHQRVWALSLAAPAWTEIVPVGTGPPVDTGYTAVMDALRDRVLVFGGGGAGGLVNGTWELTLAPLAWHALAPAGTAPSARASHAAVYDPPRDRMLIMGGNTGGATPATDTWALALTPSLAWSPVTTAAPGRGLAGVYHPAFDRWVTVGTCIEDPTGACPDPDPAMGSLWLGSRAVLAAPAPAPAASIALAQSTPNPARDGATISFSLGRPGDVSLRVFDLSGRTVRVLFEGRLPAGRHDVHWDAADAGGVAARPGAYFYELRAAGERVTRRLLLLR